MKTGTSYLQHLMDENRKELAEAGLLFPGQDRTDQTRAVKDVLEFNIHDPRIKARTEGAWPRIVKEMLAHRGEASILSMEYLSYANHDRALRVLESFPRAEVHVILTVRDVATALPAQWQTSCRNAGTLPWPRLIAGLRQSVASTGPPRSRAAHMFQRTQGTVRMLDVWAPLVDGHRLHVVTVPPRGSDPRLLWSRFATVLGVNPEIASRNPDRTNPSVFGHPTTEFLRRLNVELRDLTRGDSERLVLGWAKAGLREHARDKGPALLHRRGLLLAARWNRRVHAAIADHGVQLVGELSDLPVRRPKSPGPMSLAEPSPEQILASAVVARDALTDLEDQLWVVLGHRGPDLTDAARRPVREDLTTLPHSPARVIREVADLVRECVSLNNMVDDAGRQRIFSDVSVLAAREAGDVESG